MDNLPSHVKPSHEPHGWRTPRANTPMDAPGATASGCASAAARSPQPLTRRLVVALVDQVAPVADVHNDLRGAVLKSLKKKTKHLGCGRRTDYAACGCDNRACLGVARVARGPRVVV